MTINELELPAFLKGGGKMGELIRSKDWSKTAIGAPEHWPQSLRTSVSIVLNSQFPMFVWWGKELTTIYNDAYCPIAGEKHPSLLGKSGRDGWFEIWNDLSPLVDRVFNGTSTWSEDQVLYMNRHGYIEETYFTFSYSPIIDESGAVGGLFCACIETTEKVLATRKIEESERNLRNTILQSPVAMSILKGPTFIVEIANNRMFELWGRGPNELLHQPIFDGLPEVRNQGFEELLHNVYTTGETFRASERPLIVPRNGKPELVYVNFVYEPFREGDGSISGVIAVAIDVSEQVVVRKRVEESEARTRLAIESAHLGTYEINLAKNTITVSPRVVEIFGFEPKLPYSYDDFINAVHPDDIPIRTKAHEIAKETGELFYEVRIVLPNSSIRWIRLNGAYTNENDTTILIGTILDITEEKKAAEVLEQKIEERTKELKQANEQLRQFTYAASHDLQEPLRKISFFIDRLLVGIGPAASEDQKRMADRIQYTAKRMRTLIDDLLNYSSATLGTTGFKEIDLAVIVKGVLDDMEATIIEKNARIDIGVLPKIKGDERQLKQLLQNLISNALKYHKKDAAPYVQVQSKPVLGKDVAAFKPEIDQQSSFHLIEISDNGIGFEQEYAEKIFGLFQRLHGRSEYEGTGIGLAIVEKVVQNHHGFIWAESEPGAGATFKVLLPAL